MLTAYFILFHVIKFGSLRICNTFSFVVTSVSTLQEKMEMDVESYLRRRYEGQISDIEIVEKEDLDLV